MSPSGSCWSDYKKLLDLWLEYGVSDSYQTIVLNHIDGLPSVDRQKQTIEQEIKSTKQRESKYFVLASMLG